LGPPGGDSQASLVARVAELLDGVVLAQPAAKVAVVSHGGALSAYLAHVLGIPPERPVSFAFHNTAIARVSVQPAAGGRGHNVRVLSAGDDCHLR
jgi:broad specificity phosphatase PhoE